MTTIDSLLKAEKAYCLAHKDDPQAVFNYKFQEFDPYETGDKLDFLKNGDIEQCYQVINNFSKKEMQAFEAYGISDVEKLILLLFEGFSSKIFRVDSYNGVVPDLAEDICQVLDSLLNKTPSFDGDMLYRFCHPSDKDDFKVGNIFSPMYFLTTTKDDWEQPNKTVYRIVPLNKELTFAKSLYLIKDHGSEQQVTFKRNAKFLINKIEYDAEHNQKKICMTEIV